MAEMRTWVGEDARATVAVALGRMLENEVANPWYMADAVLDALGIDGDVTVVPGRLERMGRFHELPGICYHVEFLTCQHADEGRWDDLYRVAPKRPRAKAPLSVVPPHAEPGQP